MKRGSLCRWHRLRGRLNVGATDRTARNNGCSRTLPAYSPRTPPTAAATSALGDASAPRGCGHSPDPAVRQTSPAAETALPPAPRRSAPPGAASSDHVLSKNTNELKTGAPGRFDRHRPVASPRSGACRRRCRRFGFSVRAGKTPSSKGCHAPGWRPGSRPRAAPGPERASRLRHGSPDLDSGPLGWPLFRRCTARSVPVLLLGANVALENRD